MLISGDIGIQTGPVGADPQGPTQGYRFPAAVGGLNKRDSLAEMPETDANILTNVEPKPNYCEVRRGFSEYATGMTGTIETLMEWAGQSDSDFFAAVGGNIYDISSAGAVGAADVTGLSSNRWQSINFTTSGGHFLLCFNGEDDPLNYNGTAWATTPAITGSGLTASDLIYPTSWKSRLFLVEKNSTNVWYLPVNSIGGAATKIDFGAQLKRGGRVVAIGSVSGDAGDGIDDFLVIVSSEGEILVYQGTDPSSATTFARKARFVVGSPIGQRPLLAVGGDLVMISIDGVVSLLKSMQLDRSAIQQAAITNKIQDLFNKYARDYGSNFGWMGQIYPRNSGVYFNVPFNTTEFRQLYMNTETGGWAEFQNMNGACWGLYNDNIYFGGTNGKVYLADSTFQDDGGTISFDYQSAFSNFKRPGHQKLFQLIRPLLKTNGTPAILLGMNVEFSNIEPTGTLSPTTPGSSLWGEALWGEGMWGGDSTFFDWYSVGQIGEWGAVRMKGALNGNSFQINAFTIEGEGGGVF